jgi:DnaJ-class molecular chaperone
MNVNELDACPRCKGTGVDPDQTKKPTASGQVSADKCRQCGGSGRVPRKSK